MILEMDMLREAHEDHKLQNEAWTNTKSDGLRIVPSGFSQPAVALIPQQISFSVQSVTPLLDALHNSVMGVI